jgi:hypothetical protein
MDGQLFHLGETRIKGIRLNCCVVNLFWFQFLPCFPLNTISVSTGNFGVVLPVWTVSCGLLEYDEPMVEFLSIMMLYYVGRVPSNTIQCEALDFMVEFSG